MQSIVYDAYCDEVWFIRGAVCLCCTIGLSGSDLSYPEGHSMKNAERCSSGLRYFPLAKHRKRNEN